MFSIHGATSSLMQTRQNTVASEMNSEALLRGLWQNKSTPSQCQDTDNFAG
jgi:hypothetical protein